MTIDWPQKDLDHMQRNLTRAQRDLGKSVEDSLQWGARYLATSASAATAKAKNQRRTYTNKGGNKDFPKALFPYYREVWAGNQTTKNPEDTFRWYLREKSDDKYRKISFAGVSKKSWKWMKISIKYGGGNWAQSVDKSKRGREFTIQMNNKLPWAARALKVSNDRVLLDDALGKAARKMENQIDKRHMRKLAK